MATSHEPLVGQWYKNIQGDLFEVVAVDEDKDLVEIQYFDGSIAELDRELWVDMGFESVEPPEDWTGPYDEIVPDDLGYSDTIMQPEDWTAIQRFEGVE